MTHFRLRTQLFIATLLIICGLTGALLLIIRYTVSVETERQVRDGTEASVRAFESVQRQREQQLSRTAAMLADLPTLKAQMTTEHAPTIQDASTSWWKLSGSDLFILAMPDRRIVAFHVTKPGWPPEAAERDLKRSVEQGEDASWWYDNGRLYEVFLQTITAGAGPSSQELGFLAIGYQVDSSVAEHLALVAGNNIALATGDRLIASTLPPKDEAAMQRRLSEWNSESSADEHEIALDTDHYAFSSVLLHGALPSPVRCYVMMPLGPVNSFMNRLNRTIFILGASAILFGALLFSFVSRTITKPLDSLVSGVRALATGNYTYSITPEGTTEVAELSRAFAKMRSELLESQQQRSAISPEPTDLEQVIRRAIEAVKARPEFRNRTVALHTNSDVEGMFDAKKLERVFFNLVLNACEATPDGETRVNVDVQAKKNAFEVRVTDQGSGIPESIRASVFDPFVSSGKPNGTGLGLAIVSKIVSDHGGSVSLERTSESGTVMLVKLPRMVNAMASHSDSVA